MDPAIATILVAVIAGISALAVAYWNSRSANKNTASQAASQALEAAHNERLEFRDEQIVALREDHAEAMSKIEYLTLQVKRLTAMVISLGGDPNGS